MRVTMGLCVLLFLAQGCSVYKAATAPGPLPVENVQVGVHRNQVLSVFGMPRTTEVVKGERTEIFEFIDGNPEASKARIILYLAGDLFTLTLAELIFWPLEMATLQGTEGRAVVTYGPDNRVRALQVTEKDGTPWKGTTRRILTAPAGEDEEF